jgi:hypothetical protein
VPTSHPSCIGKEQAGLCELATGHRDGALMKVDAECEFGIMRQVSE